MVVLKVLYEANKKLIRIIIIIMVVAVWTLLAQFVKFRPGPYSHGIRNFALDFCAW